MLAFYKINDIRLNTFKINKFMPEKMKVKKDRGYFHEEISKMLQFCDERTRVIVLLLASTGIRIGAIPTLKVGNIDNSNNKITVYENTKYEYLTFCTPECKQAIDSYFDMRLRYGEKIDEECFLVREQFDIRDKFAIRKCRSIARETLQWILKDITKRSNTRSKAVHLAHGFRKFFTNQLRKSGVTTEVRWLLEGHKLKGNDPYYVRADVEEMYQEYQKAINNLTINEENRLKLKLEILEGEKNEITTLKNQVNENTSMLSDLLELIKLKAKNDLEIDDTEDQEQVNKINSINERLSQKGIKSHKYLIPSCFENKES
jgi:integrase